MDRKEKVALFLSDQCQAEGNALAALDYVSGFEHIEAVAGMPDLHLGREYPVGAAFLSKAYFYPALIGGDIGCGFLLAQSSLLARKYGPDKLLKRIKSRLDLPAEAFWDERIEALLGVYAGAFSKASPYRSGLGTIGGGNHFVEILATDELLSEEGLPEAYDVKALQFLVHSGSRGYGQSILRQHCAHYGAGALLAQSPEGQAYLSEHAKAMAYAEANRRLLAERLAGDLHSELEILSDNSHNRLSVWGEASESYYLHRKGAASAEEGAFVIAGSRGTYSYLVRPTLKDKGNLQSLAHGAGRRWQRGACKARLSEHYQREALLRNRFGGHVICADKQLLYEEAPQAYKNIEACIDCLVAHELIVPLARLKPLLTYKCRGDAYEK